MDFLNKYFHDNFETPEQVKRKNSGKIIFLTADSKLKAILVSPAPQFIETKPQSSGKMTRSFSQRNNDFPKDVT